LQAISVNNLGPKQTRKRLVMGVVMLAAGIGIAVALIVGGSDCWWRLAVFFPFWMAGLGLFQAKEKT
jgi:hypothetical protein